MVFFFPFFENLGSYVYDSMRARVRICSWKASAQRYFRWEVVQHARACSRCACACPLARRVARDGRLAALGVLGGSAAKWTNVVWPIKRRQTNQQTNKHTLLFYRYRLADHAEPCSATVPRRHWAAEKQTWKLSPSFSPLPTHDTWRASSYQAQTSWWAELPVPCTHFFYALTMIMLGTLAYLAHTNKHFKIRVFTTNCNNLLIITKLSKSENAADFSPQKADQNMKQVGWQES